MAFFSSSENRVKCGKCGTEFDINKNKDGCPLCGFGRIRVVDKEAEIKISSAEQSEHDLLKIPNDIKLPQGKVIVDEESGKVGLWGMFNDFFSGKALLRINANLLEKDRTEYISLNKLIENSKKTMYSRNLLSLKGFPNDIEADSSVGRLVYHFVAGFHKIGLFEVKVVGTHESKSIWNHSWEDLMIRPTKEGLEFARIRNRIFEDKDYENQTLTKEESVWMINYLKEIDKKGFKEYSLLKEIKIFIQEGHNGNKDLWEWFKKNPSFISYIKYWSSKNNNPKAFEKQLTNLSQTFSSGKISLLRELGIIQNKRNDYTIIGEI